MNGIGVRYATTLLTALLLTASFASAAKLPAPADARNPSTAEVKQAVTQYLESQRSEDSTAELQASAVADLNGDGQPEIIVVWQNQGSTWWNFALGVLGRKADKTWTQLAITGLGNQAELISVNKGVISIHVTELGPNDPMCCPTVNQTLRYRLHGADLEEITR